MKNATLLLTAITIAIGFSAGCKKSDHFSSPDPSDASLIRDSRDYFQRLILNSQPKPSNESPRTASQRFPLWDSAKVIQMGVSKAVVVPVRYDHPIYIRMKGEGKKIFNINGLVQLLLYKDSTRHFQVELLTAIPDTNCLVGADKSFRGMLLIDDWDGYPLRRYVSDGRQVKVTYPDQSTPLIRGLKDPKTVTAVYTVCYVVDGYNYASSDPESREYWSEPAGCNYIDLPSAGRMRWNNYSRVAMVGSSHYNYRQTRYVDRNSNIIDGYDLNFVYDNLPGIDLTKYFKCFTYIPDAGATYSVTICADLPVNDNPEALLDRNFQCGHSFLIFTKTNGNSSASLSFGFYPQRILLSLTTLPLSSKVSDDGAVAHEYNGSLTMNGISALDFMTLEHEAENLANSMKYDIGDYNCTNFALDVFNSIRPTDPLQVPDWIGSYTGLDFGATPNGLYSLIKSMEYNKNGTRNFNVQIGVMRAPQAMGPCN